MVTARLAGNITKFNPAVTDLLTLWFKNKSATAVIISYNANKTC
ncbi:hypothetical protein [Anaerocolumna sp.]|nr:hypothetical protein [Anaerocolumna sp.]